MKRFGKWLLVIFSVLVMYIVYALKPYFGPLYVSEEVRSAFSYEAFFGDAVIPERVMILDEGQEAFFHKINLLSQAQQTIAVSTYSIHKGEAAEIFIGALLAAADRGVEVSFMVNGLGGGMPRSYRQVLAAHPLINLYIFNRPQLLEPQFFNASLHDKYIVADDHLMILGGRNISDRYFWKENYEGANAYDMGVLVYNTDRTFSGSISQVHEYHENKRNSTRVTLVEGSTGRTDSDQFISAYTAYWQGQSEPKINYYDLTVEAKQITLITNPFETARKEAEVGYTLMRLATSSEETLIMNPYISLTPQSIELMGQLLAGESITLLTNSLASTPNLPAFSNYYVSRDHILAQTDFIIYEFQSNRESLHGKAFVFDERLTAIGSFNMNERSLRSDTESMLIIDSEELNGITRDAIESLMSRSLQVADDGSYILNEKVPAATYSRSKQVLYRVVGRLARPFRFMF